MTRPYSRIPAGIVRRLLVPFIPQACPPEPPESGYESSRSSESRRASAFPRANQITSPGRISSIAWPTLCALPQPAVTIKVWPNGCVCQAVRAPGSKVTLAPRARAGSGASKSGSMRTVPVKYSFGPVVEGCEPILVIFIFNPPGFKISDRRASLRRGNLRITRARRNDGGKDGQQGEEKIPHHTNRKEGIRWPIC